MPHLSIPDILRTVAGIDALMMSAYTPKGREERKQ